MITFNSARLRYRPIQPTDYFWLCDLFSDPEVMKYIGEYAPRDEQAAHDSLQRMLDHWVIYPFGIFAVELIATGEPIGRCGVGFFHNDEVPELSYSFFRRFWGRGFATEAVRAVIQFGFESQRFPRIIAHARKENTASLRVLEKVGMQLVGETRIDDFPAVGYQLENPNWNVTSL